MNLDGPAVELRHELAVVHPDGMLLYVAHASYEPGTSPLSTWVPIRSYDDQRTHDRDVDMEVSTTDYADGPLNMFERYVQRFVVLASALNIT